MAVENDEDFTLTKYCSQNNVVVSIGHSNATYEQAVQAYAPWSKKYDSCL